MARLLQRYWNSPKPDTIYGRRRRWWRVCEYGHWGDDTLQSVELDCFSVGDWTGARLARLFLMCSITQRTKAETLARKLPGNLK